MKIKNKNMIVFVLVSVFVISGIGLSFVKEMYTAVKQFAYEIKDGNEYAISNFTSAVDSGSAAGIRYHDILMNINSFKERLLNTKVIQKDDSTIAVAEGGTLVAVQEKISDEALGNSAETILPLYEAATENGADFLYVAAPKKGYGFSLPSSVEDYTTDNYDRYVSALTEAQIPTLSLAKEMQEQGLLTPEAFYTTDHHWTIETGFWAAGEICQELNERYDFPYEQEALDISNYKVTTYENWFLGSLGKKVGAYLLPTGADEFSLIVPKFKTELTEKQPFKNQTRSGSFEKVALYMENIDQKDWYEKNPYAGYSGGDFRLQILKNSLSANDKKILIIRDSFACAVTPFLSLQAKELHVADVRNFEDFAGEKLNVYDYIKEIDPDYVLVLYMGAVTAENSGMLDFD